MKETYPPTDWRGLLWETRGWLALPDDAPVPRAELCRQAREHGYTSTEVEQGLAQSSALHEVDGYAEPHVILHDATSGIEDSSTTKADHLATDLNAGGNEPTPNWHKWADADFSNPECDTYPPSRLEPKQSMARKGKLPYAPWTNPNAPAECSNSTCPDHDEEDDKEIIKTCDACQRHRDDELLTCAECEHSARYKWSYTENYRDGETLSMYETNEEIDGRAFIQLEGDGWGFVDGDKVRCPKSGDVHPAFIAILEHLGLTYADVSMSGTGIHAQYHGELPIEGKGQATFEIDTDLWGANDEPPTVEIYANKHVCVDTGKHIPGTPLEITEWDADTLRAILKANDYSDEPEIEHDTDHDFPDLEGYEPMATTADEVTDDIRDIFAAINRLQPHDLPLQAKKVGTDSTGWEKRDPSSYRPSSSGESLHRPPNEAVFYDQKEGESFGVMSLFATEQGIISKPWDHLAGTDWWETLDAAREAGAPIPELETTPTSDRATGHRATIETCEPPIQNTTQFDREQRWNQLRDARFDAVLASDCLDIYADEAGSGKTTNALLAAVEQGEDHVVYFDKHAKAREATTDPVLPNDYFHLKGGEQKRKGHCMDADYDDENCSEHGRISDCPSMCPIYDLPANHEIREAYKVLVREVGPKDAHRILRLNDEAKNPWHRGECPWQAQYNALESANDVAAVHPYMTQRSVCKDRLNIIDETPNLNTFERTVSVAELTRIANTLKYVADQKLEDSPVKYTARNLAEFTRNIIDVLTDAGGTETIADLETPTIISSAYQSHDSMAGNYIEKVEPNEDWQFADALARTKISIGETIFKRMRSDVWEGTPISIDVVLAAAVEAGLDETPTMQAIAVSPMLEACPLCNGDLASNKGARYCSDDGCDWHEAHNSFIQRGTESARASVWTNRSPTGTANGLVYRELPPLSELPDPANTLILDATATPEKVAALFGCDLDDVRVTGNEALEMPNLWTTKVLDGQYHSGTIVSAVDDDQILADRIQRTITNAGNDHQKPLYVVKKDLTEEFDFPANGVVIHYHATRGLNYDDCDAVVCIGAPHPNVDDLERNAQLLAMGRDDIRVGGAEHSTRRDAPNRPVYRKLYYKDKQGHGRAIPTKHFTGLVGELFREAREKEIVQAVHRIRPLLTDETNYAYILTNVPTSLPIDEICSFEELADPLKALLPVSEGAIKLLEAVCNTVADNGPDGSPTAQHGKQYDEETIVNTKREFHCLAQQSGLDVTYKTISCWVNDLEDLGLLQPEDYEQRKGVPYSADLATLTSALSVLSNNGGVKVALARRIQSLATAGDGSLEWLNCAHDATGIEGERCT